MACLWGAVYALAVGKQPWAEVELTTAGLLWAVVHYSATGRVCTDTGVMVLLLPFRTCLKSITHGRSRLLGCLPW